MAKTPKHSTDIVRAGLEKRYKREARFRRMGMAAIILGLVFVSMLFISIIGNGYTAFWQTFIRLEVQLDASLIDPDGTRDPAVIAGANYGGLVKKSLREMFPEVSGRRDKRTLYGIVSSGATYDLKDYVVANPDSIGSTIQLWVPADDDVDMLMKGHFDRDKPEAERRIKDKQIAWVDKLVAENRVESRFNKTFFTAGDSREPELAGIQGAATGSFFTLVVTLLLAFPLGVATAVYLEEFAPQNKWTDLIEVNINNLAAVPSIVFGLLGLAVFINFIGMPRSAPLVGGLVLTLMTLPTIIIASRAALKSVPPSIREAAPGRCVEDADGVSSCIAAGDAGYADRHHHRYGAGARRIGAVADDRHGCVYRGHTRQRDRSCDGAAGTDLFMGGQPGACIRGANFCRHYGTVGIFDHHECTGSAVAQKIRTSLVTRGD